MIHAYDKLYLEDARTNLARMLDYAVVDMQFELTEFWNLFLVSKISADFGAGDCKYVAGMSGVELVYAVLDSVGKTYARIEPNYGIDRSPEYWTGWVLAYYQWRTGLTFAAINDFAPIACVRDMYHPYHEMDILHFCDQMDSMYWRQKTRSNLQRKRLRAKLTQKQLAQYADVPIRTIQQYEQRQKDINKAKLETVVRLAHVLHCTAEDLLEKIPLPKGKMG